jgi:hypothetical protein
MLGEKAQADLILSAESHEKGTATDITEADNTADSVDGDAQAHFTINLDNDGLALL